MSGKEKLPLIIRLADLLDPPKCPFCGRVMYHRKICSACTRTLPWVEEKHVVRKGSGGLRCAAPLWYEGGVRKGLLDFKFHGESEYAILLGELLARCAAEQFSGEFDTVTWVPVSRKRLRHRGYDQARLLARQACLLWSTRPERLLVKTVHNRAQSRIHDAAQRKANVLGVYRLAGGADVRGRRILLVDDICTTGATLTECVRVLRDAGAADVMCAAVAQAREKGEKRKELPLLGKAGS